MSRYERAYDSWTTLEKDEAIERAYALGVAASIGERHPEELDAIREEMDSAYNKSVVDLAFEEGRTEAHEAEANPADESEAVWAELVEGKTVPVDADEMPTGGRDGLPEAVDRIEALDRPEMDSTGAVDRPEFLERD